MTSDAAPTRSSAAVASDAIRPTNANAIADDFIVSSTSLEMCVSIEALSRQHGQHGAALLADLVPAAAEGADRVRRLDVDLLILQRRFAALDLVGKLADFLEEGVEHLVFAHRRDLLALHV